MPITNTYLYSSPLTAWIVIKVTLGELSFFWSLTSLTKLTSFRKSSSDAIPLSSSKVLVIDLNSFKFSNLISASRVCSLSSSLFIPDLSSTMSIVSVKDKTSLFSFISKISFLNSNSFPLLITSNIDVPLRTASMLKFSIVLAPIFLFG